MVRFSGLGACGSRAGLGASTAACTTPCDQFVTAANIFPDFTEWCSIGTTTETWFSIDADCCAPTPARPRTRGTVKTRYR